MGTDLPRGSTPHTKARREIRLPAETEDAAVLICHYFTFPGNNLRLSRDQ